MGGGWNWLRIAVGLTVMKPCHVSVNKGTTVIQRKSSESSVTIPDRETTKTLVRRVEEALHGKETYTVNKVELCSSVQPPL
jgi:hypothetical protein